MICLIDLKTRTTPPARHKMSDAITPLFLGPESSPVFHYLLRTEANVAHTDAPITHESPLVQNSNFLVSFGYRHIVSETVLEHYNGRAINLHMSLLPWNRGADPNLWSFLENTPKGISIHLMTAALDEGALLIQQEYQFDKMHTLATSYQTLSEGMVLLFKESWTKIKEGSLTPYPQMGRGSYHRSADKAPFLNLLEAGWDTPVERLTGLANETPKTQ